MASADAALSAPLLSGAAPCLLLEPFHVHVCVHVCVCVYRVCGQEGEREEEFVVIVVLSFSLSLSLSLLSAVYLYISLYMLNSAELIGRLSFTALRNEREICGEERRRF